MCSIDLNIYTFFIVRNGNIYFICTILTGVQCRLIEDRSNQYSIRIYDCQSSFFTIGICHQWRAYDFIRFSKILIMLVIYCYEIHSKSVGDTHWIKNSDITSKMSDRPVMKINVVNKSDVNCIYGKYHHSVIRVYFIRVFIHYIYKKTHIWFSRCCCCCFSNWSVHLRMMQYVWNQKHIRLIFR